MAINPIPRDFACVSPYLLVKDIDEVLDFIMQTLDGEINDRAQDEEGNTIHVSFKVADSLIMIGRAGDKNPALKSMVHVYVDNVDETFERAMEAGGVSIRPPEDTYYGDRSAGVAGPQGNMWWFASRIEELSPDEIDNRIKKG